eukprot:scaffold15191_cov69-Cylindrotheca_fusiformis.AAC.1
MVSRRNTNPEKKNCLCSLAIVRHAPSLRIAQVSLRLGCTQVVVKYIDLTKREKEKILPKNEKRAQDATMKDMEMALHSFTHPPTHVFVKDVNDGCHNGRIHPMKRRNKF